VSFICFSSVQPLTTNQPITNGYARAATSDWVCCRDIGSGLLSRDIGLRPLSSKSGKGFGA
jgi:hypothetical protein